MAGYVHAQKVVHFLFFSSAKIGFRDATAKNCPRLSLASNLKRMRIRYCNFSLLQHVLLLFL